MKIIKTLFFSCFFLLFISSCVYIKHPFTYKLTRGNWINDTTQLAFNDLPKLIKDTLSSYYAKDSVFFPELISLNESVDVCFIEYVTFPSKTIFLHTPGYYFRIGSRKYFFDYRKYNTPIVYYENTLYYFSDKYSVKKDRYTFESQSDYENKLFVKYSLKESNLKKHIKLQKDCSKKSNYNFVNTISP